MDKRKWRSVLRVVAATMVPLEIVDALLVDVPVPMIVWAVALTFGAFRLGRPGNGPVYLVGAVCAIQLVLITLFFVVFTPSPAPEPIEYVVGGLLAAGCTAALVSAAGALRGAEPKVETAAPA